MNEKPVKWGSKLLAASEGGAANKSRFDHGCDSRPASFAVIEEIHLRAETVTPLLREIAAFEPPPL